MFGYKAQLAVKHGSDLIRGVILTGADVGGSLGADAVISGDEAGVYADKAYDAGARREEAQRKLVETGSAGDDGTRCRAVDSDRWAYFRSVTVPRSSRTGSCSS